MGVCVREGEGVATLLEAGYFMQVAKEHCRIHVSFRVDTCSSAGGSTLGDMLANRRGANVLLSLTCPAAEQQGWFLGSCFCGMGLRVNCTKVFFHCGYGTACTT